MSDLVVFVVFVAIVGLVAAVGVVVGMIVARRIDRILAPATQVADGASTVEQGNEEEPS